MSREKIKDKAETTNCLGTPHNVILFNDTHHSFDEVMLQLVAMGCSPSRAHELTMKAHSLGRAIVYTGALETCELKEAILAGPPASLRTAIEPA